MIVQGQIIVAVSVVGMGYSNEWADPTHHVVQLWCLETHEQDGWEGLAYRKAGYRYAKTGATKAEVEEEAQRFAEEHSLTYDPTSEGYRVRNGTKYEGGLMDIFTKGATT
jgi:hypothetical protein